MTPANDAPTGSAPFGAGPALYDTRRARMAFLRDSYVGGEAYRTPTLTTLSDARVQWNAIDQQGNNVPQSKRFVSYLVPHPAESDQSFQCRLALASYVNPVSVIVDAYAEGCTSEIQRQLGALDELADDVDLRGSAWGEYVEEVARWTEVYGFTATVIDAPSAADVANRAEEQAAGIRPYCVMVPPPSWAWVEVDDFGQLTEFAYVDSPYQPVQEGAIWQRVRVRVWSTKRQKITDGDPAGVDRPGWQVLEGQVGVGFGLAGVGFERERFTVVDEGDLDPRLKGRLPVVLCFYRRDSQSKFPFGLSLVEDAADLARVIYNKRSWEQQIAREAGFPTLAIPLASTGGQMDPQTATAIGPSKAIGYNSAAGSPSWIQPSAEWAQDLRTSCMADFQFALRSAGLELAADQSAQVQSGEALRIKSRDFESRAKRFARNLQRFETQALELFALLAGVKADATVTYPRRFTLPDLAGDLQRALDLLTKSPTEIGPTAKLEAVVQAASAALTLTEEQQQKVRDEVEKILAQDVEEAEAQRQARLDGLTKPPQPGDEPDGDEGPDAVSDDDGDELDAAGQRAAGNAPPQRRPGARPAAPGA